MIMQPTLVMEIISKKEYGITDEGGHSCNL